MTNRASSKLFAAMRLGEQKALDGAVSFRLYADLEKGKLRLTGMSALSISSDPAALTDLW
ncbi:MAG: hypothetical protein QOH71_459 [Blastocatellia bacterium]|nr:hypothetical protein [Blastocatellia bacterium]